eukprot:4356343-Pyramimonas_sp.AAC.1
MWPLLRCAWSDLDSCAISRTFRPPEQAQIEAPFKKLPRSAPGPDGLPCSAWVHHRKGREVLAVFIGLLGGTACP